MFGSSEVWLIQSVLGIQPHPAAKGFDKVLIKPAPPSQLEHASGSFQTPRGLIEVSWERKAGGGFTLKTTIPPNVQATVHVPSKPGTSVSEAATTEELGGRRIPGALALEIGSGAHEFTSTL